MSRERALLLFALMRKRWFRCVKGNMMSPPNCLEGDLLSAFLFISHGFSLRCLTHRERAELSSER